MRPPTHCSDSCSRRSASRAAATASTPAHPFALADEHLAHGDLERAEAALGRALQRGADRAGGLARLAGVFVRRGLHGEALERFAEARALAPHDRDSVLGEMRALRQLGRLHDARALAGELVARWAHDAEALAVAALAAADADDVEMAMGLLARAAVGARSADAWRDLATTWRVLGDVAAAVAAQRRVVELRPDDPRERLSLAHALRDASLAAESEAVLRALLRDVPALVDATLGLAALRVEAGAPGEAVALLATVAARDPWHVDAIAQLAAALADGGRPRDAAVAAARARRLDPEHALALAVQGDCLRAAGDRDAAVAAWRRVLASEPVGAAAARARAGLRAFGEAA